jgi:NAD(P)-dependent dehydrogenase (short-subunit alcohol dehydrogenase family)
MQAPDVSSRPIAQLISLEGRTAVVTGGARGIGLAIATRFAEAGANVLIGDLNKSGAEEAAEAIAREFGHQAIAVELDVTSGASIAAAADRAILELGGLDIWVNNAGIYPSTPLLEMTDQDWDKVLDVNLRGTFIGAREAGRRMAEAGQGGVIINLASTAGYRAAGPGIAHYVASKHGVRGLTKSLAVELGPHGIRVLASHPAVPRYPVHPRPGLRRPPQRHLADLQPGVLRQHHRRQRQHLAVPRGRAAALPVSLPERLQLAVPDPQAEQRAAVLADRRRGGVPARPGPARPASVGACGARGRDRRLHQRLCRDHDRAPKPWAR